jgi:hypothetical protein
MKYLMKCRNSFGALALMTPLLFACQEKGHTREITVRNRLDLDRERETLSIEVDQIRELADLYGAEKLLIREAETGEILVSQAVDADADGRIDEILFQTDIKANATKKFLVDRPAEGARQPESEYSTYSRFVPERIDDYAWENDRVAFRTYGPEAQRITESGEPGGTLTSGMDAWLKRVQYPVIDKWYAAHQEEPGAYHIDSGEGYDPYHVGAGRGIGGIGVWADDSIYVSKNFTDYKTIATGPIRTIFELTYAPWEARGSRVRERKRISLDLGSNLSHFEVALEKEGEVPNFAIGLSLHEKEGEVKAAPDQGWFRYWEPMDGSALGVAVVLDPKLVQQYIDHRVATPDQSHLLVLTDPEQSVLNYYAGFGWEKSGQFNSAQEWDQYLEHFSRRLASPLEVVVE